MSYVNKDLKAMIGIIAGFIIGIVAAAIISPLICGNQFLIPIGIVSVIGFPILLCTRPDMKSLLITVVIIIICIVATLFILNMQEQYQIHKINNL